MHWKLGMMEPNRSPVCLLAGTGETNNEKLQGEPTVMSVCIEWNSEWQIADLTLAS